MTWPRFMVSSLPAADAAPMPLSPAQITSTTGQALLSEHSNDATSAWLFGGPLTNRNEHPEESDNIRIIALSNLILAMNMTLPPEVVDSLVTR